MEESFIKITIAIIFLTAIFESYKLKKFKASVTFIITSFFLTVVYNLFTFLISFGLFSFLLDLEKSPIPILIGILAIILISFLRFKNRNYKEYIEGKKVKDKNWEKFISEKKIPKKDLLEKDIDQGIFACFFIVILNLIFLVITKDDYYNFYPSYYPEDFLYRFIDPAVFLLLAVWAIKRDPFFPILISTGLFLIGKYMFIAEMVDRGIKGTNYGISSLSILIAYFLIRGLYASYLKKYK